jgi:deoxyribodipyrimidine photo-lyase
MASVISHSPIVLFLHHRDLRIVDNRGLEAACAYAKEHGAVVAPVFIFTPSQVGRSAHIKSYMSIACMLTGLGELEEAYGGSLGFYYGETTDVVRQMKDNVVGVFECADYTPYAKKRSAALKAVLESSHIHYEQVDDIYINTPGSVLNGTGKPYQKFTPYYEASLKKRVDRPSGACRGPFIKKAIGLKSSVSLKEMVGRLIKGTAVSHSEGRAYKGGREEGLRLLANLPANYAEIHDILAERTSGLSVHNHYGTVSIREVYWKAKERGLDALVRQLYWRDFYGQIVAFFEDLYGVGAYEFQTSTSANPRYESLSAAKAKVLKAWKEGKTGVPLVDAAMRQMNETGFMHNRARLVAASWLVKDMGIWWRWGERYFAERLLDYDFSQNFGNWCWVASVLPFSQAPFRRHDPETTAERLDKDGIYVRRWLKE